MDHVVNFDFPLNPVDYLHRSGRTARAGATGARACARALGAWHACPCCSMHACMRCRGGGHPPHPPSPAHTLRLAGKITSLVGKGDRVLGDRIEDALARGLPLDALSASREVLPPHMR